jgi:hypothetical protein
MLRKLGSYPRQNGLAVALHELGRIERTLFILDWLQSVELRRRVRSGLNKGEARNALARAVFFNRLGEIRVTAAVVLWNTVYLERAAHALRGNGHAVDAALLHYLIQLRPRQGYGQRGRPSGMHRILFVFLVMIMALYVTRGQESGRLSRRGSPTGKSALRGAD